MSKEMTRILTIFAVAAVAACASTQSARESLSVTPNACPHIDGMIDGPFVPDEATARTIAAAVIDQFQSEDRQDQYELEIEDDGRYWTVWQTIREYPKQEGDTFSVIMGGGGLTMRIAKCDGAISYVHGLR